MKRYWIFFLSVLVVMAACTQAAQPTVPSEGPVDVPATDEVMTDPRDEVIPHSVDALAAETPPDRLSALVSKELGMDAEDLLLVSSEEVVWRDASLGCPEPGKMYAQVLIEGWRFTFEDASGNQHDIHSAANVEDFVVCESSEFEVITGDEISQLDPDMDDPLVQSALQVLIASLNISADEVTFVSKEAVEWNDSCLGCGGPAESCLRAVTPGYQIFLDYDGTAYDLRVDQTGRYGRLCKQ